MKYNKVNVMKQCTWKKENVTQAELTEQYDIDN